MTLFLSATAAHSQKISCEADITPEMQKELIETAVRISEAFGPDYKIADADRIVITGPETFFAEDDPRPEVRRVDGREYYSVFFYPENRKMFDWGYYSTVDIWLDGSPQGVTYGNGYGVNFLFDTPEDLMSQPDHLVIPLQYSEFYKNR